jgi:hypothetical protein
VELVRRKYLHERCDINTSITSTCIKYGKNLMCFILGCFIAGVIIYSCIQLYFNWNPEGRTKVVVWIEDKSTSYIDDSPIKRRSYEH